MEARERIIIKAHELFSRFGFRRVTMDEIALKTGMSKKTIYQSFGTKDEIVAAVVEEHLSKSVCVCEGNATQAENAVHEIFLTMEMVEDIMAAMNPAVFEDLEKFFPNVFGKLYQHKNDFIFQKVKGNIERGKQEGLYRQELDSDIITKLRIETMFIPFNQQVFPVAKYRLADVEREMLEHFVYGLCTPKGLQLVEKYKQERFKK
jgi:TetR/AcrR family transcriptional regulator, cholesterol catabolism regulator